MILLGVHAVKTLSKIGKHEEAAQHYGQCLEWHSAKMGESKSHPLSRGLSAPNLTVVGCFIRCRESAPFATAIVGAISGVPVGK